MLAGNLYAEGNEVDSAGSATRNLLARLSRLVEPALVTFTVGALAAGGIAWLAGSRDVADQCWVAGAAVAAPAALAWTIVAVRAGRLGVDLIAVLSLIGTLLMRAYLAGNHCLARLRERAAEE